MKGPFGRSPAEGGAALGDRPLSAPAQVPKGSASGLSPWPRPLRPSAHSLLVTGLYPPQAPLRLRLRVLLFTLLRFLAGIGLALLDLLVPAAALERGCRRLHVLVAVPPEGVAAGARGDHLPVRADGAAPEVGGRILLSHPRQLLLSTLKLILAALHALVELPGLLLDVCRFLRAAVLLSFQHAVGRAGHAVLAVTLLGALASPVRDVAPAAEALVDARAVGHLCAVR